jgi:cell division protein FtsL
LLAIIVSFLLVSSMYPARTLVAKRARLTTLKKQSAELDRRIADLRSQRDALQTDAEVERLAREQLGMIRPGETAFAVVPAQSPLPAPPARSVQPSRAGEEGLLSRWWDAVYRTFRVPR